MSLNVSFADPPLSPHFSSSNSSLHALFDKCLKSREGLLIVTAFSVTDVLLIGPLCFAVLYMGFQRWGQRYSASKAPMMSHADFFTYNIIAMIMIEVLSSVLYSVGGHTSALGLVRFGFILFVITWALKLQFHTLSCVERYLAVIHPVIYLSLKNGAGVRIRNISTGCVWLQFILWCGLQPVLTDLDNTIVFFALVTFASVVVCFCSIYVLCALSRPGPGEVHGDRERVDQSKRRAFCTILRLLGYLLLGLVMALVCCAVSISLPMGYSSCVLVMSSSWFGLPSSLALPLLYLQRAGKLRCCTHNTESG